MTVVFTGQGSTELAEKWDTSWVSIFRTLKEYGGVNFTRIDLALDDYDEAVRFSDIEKKLNKGHYRSSRKSYNIVKTSDQNGKPLGQTIYIGNARSQNGSRGNVYARFYDKKRSTRVRTNFFQPKSETIGQGLGKKFGNGMKLAILKNTLKKSLMSFYKAIKSTRFLKHRFVIFLRF